MNHPPLNKWNEQWIKKDGRFFVFLGPHGVGKSTLLSYVVQHCNEYVPIQDWIGFSPTEGGIQTLRGLIPDAYVHKRVPSEKDLNELVIGKQQMEIDIKDSGEYPGYEPRALGVIIDDSGFKSKIFKSEALKNLVMNQRWYRIHIFITLQYIRQLDPENFNNVDYLFLLGVPDPKNSEVLMKDFFMGRLGIDANGVRFRQRERERLNYYFEFYNQPGSCIAITKVADQKSKIDYVSTYQWPENVSKSYMGDAQFLETCGVDEDGNQDEEIRRQMQRSQRKESIHDLYERTMKAKYMYRGISTGLTL